MESKYFKIAVGVAALVTGAIGASYIYSRRAKEPTDRLKMALDNI